MKNIIAIIIAMAISLSVQAQKASIAIGCKPGKSGKLITQIKFLFPDKVVSEYALNIYRKSSDEQVWQKLNATPFSKASQNENFTDEDYRFYQSYLKRKPAANAEDENNAQAMAGLFIIDNNNFARYAGCYYEDSTAQEGKTYQYKITNAASGDNEIAIAAPFTVKENYLPNITTINGKQKRQQVQLLWKEDQLFFAYNVYKKSSHDAPSVLVTKEAIMLGVVGDIDAKTLSEQPKFIDSFVANGTVFYEVAGIDVLGNESKKSAPFKMEIKDLTPPFAVKNVRGKRAQQNAIVDWDAAADKDLAGYNIYRNNDKDTAYKKVNDMLVKEITYTDKSLKEGDVYGYKIETVDDAGNTTLSRPTMVFFPDQSPPAKPKGLKAISSPGIVQLTWDKNTESDLKGYFIFRASNRDKEYFNMLYRYPIEGESYTDTLPANAKNEFVYYLQAVDEDFNTSEPSDTVVVMLPDTTAPIAPAIRSIVAEKGNVIITIDLRDEDALSYDVYRSSENEQSRGYKQVNSKALKDKQFMDTSLPNGLLYNYYIISNDKAGNKSEASQAQSVFLPEEEQELLAAKITTINYNNIDSSIILSWENKAINVSGYIVYRKDAASDFIPISEMQKANRFVDTPIEQGGNYEYMVRTFFAERTVFANSIPANIKAE